MPFGQEVGLEAVPLGDEPVPRADQAVALGKEPVPLGNEAGAAGSKK